MKKNEIAIIENCIENKNEKLDVKEEPYEKLMFFYRTALKELEVQMNIIKDEFKIMYNYDLIDHINSRIKEPKSIIKKMEKKGYEKTYLNLIEKINDIAGIRIVCNLKDDIFFIRDLIKNISDINIGRKRLNCLFAACTGCNNICYAVFLHYFKITLFILIKIIRIPSYVKRYSAAFKIRRNNFYAAGIKNFNNSSVSFYFTRAAAKIYHLLLKFFALHIMRKKS